VCALALSVMRRRYLSLASGATVGRVGVAVGAMGRLNSGGDTTSASDFPSAIGRISAWVAGLGARHAI
jgi:hypothetical protein